MRYRALATDYDGTIARDGVVPEGTLRALRNVRDSGRRLILVTGRVLPDLLAVFPGIGLFDRVVAENGALLWRPSSGDERLLAAPAPALADLLRGQASAGRVIVAIAREREGLLREAIRTLGLEWRLIHNRGGAMALPAGVDKASGLRAALAELGMSPLEAVGVGDAENDLDFLRICWRGVAVPDALPALRERADWTADVVELAERLIADDLA